MVWALVGIKVAVVEIKLEKLCEAWRTNHMDQDDWKLNHDGFSTNI